MFHVILKSFRKFYIPRIGFLLALELLFLANVSYVTQHLSLFSPETVNRINRTSLQSSFLEVCCYTFYIYYHVDDMNEITE